MLAANADVVRSIGPLLGANGTALRLSGLPNSPLLIDNIDVIYARHYWWSSSSPLMLPWGEGGNRGSGVIFSNIAFTDLFLDSPAISIPQDGSGDFAGARFENLTIADTRKNILGSANTNAWSIHDLTFNNLVIGGVLVTPSNWLNYFTTNGNVYNIFFTASGVTPPDALPRTGWVASASASGGGSAANAIDGDCNSRWSTGTDQANGQWFQVDMASARTFNQIVMDANSSTGGYPRGYEVKVSNDGTNWGSSVATGTGSNAVITVTFATQTARYIRVTQTGSAGLWWSIHEFNVYSTTAFTYTLTKSLSNGTMALNPAWPTYPAGTVVTVTAVPNAGYVFNNWSGDLSGSANPSTITMTTNNSVTANFSASSATYTLTTTSPNGTVTLNPAGPTYPVNTAVTLTAVPNSGFVFTGWGGALSGSANPTTITMNANKSITASIDYPVLPRTG